ncbi:MAG: two-component sensor histidine kinase [Agarilytica sp.]
MLLYFMFEIGVTSNTFGHYNPSLFRISSLSYVVLTVVSLVLLFDKESYRSPLKVLLLLAIDLIALLTLVHASGGLGGGLGYLLVITAAISSMFLPGQLALAYAAAVSILLLLQTVFTPVGKDLTKELFSAGTLGFLVFITTISFYYLTTRIQSTAKEAAEKSAYAKQVVQLAQLIVTRMQTGIAVVNEFDQIELINDSAKLHLDLDINKLYLGTEATEIADLAEILEVWRNNPVTGMAHVHKIRGRKDVRINFASVETESRPILILYIEDYRTLIQQAQQLKLASLGRLTASIAHEVRNPLGAISHASQLLSESEHIDPADKRFTEIILQHSNRVNEIIENVMTISKRQEPKAEQIKLVTWIPQFIEEYSTAKECTIVFQHEEAQPDVKMDPTHLRQILTNLFDNGLRYSMEATGRTEILVKSGSSKSDDISFIDVIDHGPGVSPDNITEIFEPFFTTGQQGTGLGLYISRELCEINQAHLIYSRTKDNKSRFKIEFSHHQRMI